MPLDKVHTIEQAWRQRKRQLLDERTNLCRTFG